MTELVPPTRRTSPAADDTVRIAQSAPSGTDGASAPVSVIFIHGLWLHASSWERWVDYFADAGYSASAPGWPDFPDSIEQARNHPEFMFDMTIGEVADHYANIIRALPAKPVVIGHSFGGLIAQKLLDQDLVSAVVAIDPVPIRGVLWVPFSQLRSAWPVLRNPFSLHRAVTLRPQQFRYSFANQLTEAEAAELYYTWTIPAPAKPLWQAVFALFNPKAETRVDTHKDRAPLLLMAGRHDNTVPPQTTRIVHRLYARPPAVTDIKEWPRRGHSLTIDSGWRELAEYSLGWLELHGLGPHAAP